MRTERVGAIVETKKWEVESEAVGTLQCNQRFSLRYVPAQSAAFEYPPYLELEAGDSDCGDSFYLSSRAGVDRLIAILQEAKELLP